MDVGTCRNIWTTEPVGNRPDRGRWRRAAADRPDLRRAARGLGGHRLAAGYDGDLDACLDGRVEAAEGETPLVESEDVPAPKTVDRAIGGVYELSDLAVVYFACRTLVLGEAVLRVRFATTDDNYEAALPVLEDLLAGIELSEG